MRVAINGLGRIGRCLVRGIFESEEYKDIELVAVNASMPIETLTHLLKYDSIHGRFSKEICANKDGNIVIDGKEVKLLANRNPEELPWKELDIDVVLEATGVFTTREGAAKHIQAGAKKVLISAPSKSEDVKTVVYGVNDEIITSDDDIISVGSCTTNCLAPVAKILDATVGIEKGFMTTIHAYTNDQNIVDNKHKDLRRARACAMSMIPTSTGAAKAVGLVLPNLKGKLDGGAVRVPTANVSMVDLNFVAKRNTSAAEINKIIEDATKADAKTGRILEIVKDPLVSIDFNHSKYSSNFDTLQTKVMAGDMVKIGAWYDNEWGFSLRMLDVANILAGQK
jgi:glyceraldehyde 3-phosphate dehydrogenase